MTRRITGLWTKHLLRMFPRPRSVTINQIFIVMSEQHISDMLLLRHRMCMILFCRAMHITQNHRKSATSMFGEVGDRLVHVCGSLMQSVGNMNDLEPNPTMPATSLGEWRVFCPSATPMWMCLQRGGMSIPPSSGQFVKMEPGWMACRTSSLNQCVVLHFQLMRRRVMTRPNS